MYDTITLYCLVVRITVRRNAIETVSLARRIVDLAEDKQAHDIALLDIHTQSTIADFFVICSGDNERQLRAIVDHIDGQVQKQYGLNPRIEGSSDSGWIVIDYADVVVHVFSNAQRDYYRLDRLWSKVPPVVVVQ
jgi:ribosome-associated protein